MAMSAEKLKRVGVERTLKGSIRTLAAAGAMLVAALGAEPAMAQKPGGVLKLFSSNTPASMSIHDESTRYAVTPVMGVFNNLVIFDQHVVQNTLDSIRPDLADSWSWDDRKTALTFRLHQGIK